MEDTEIMELFWARNEDAIKETDAVYGRKLNTLAKNILLSREDAEESVSDTYMETWKTIPPHRPKYFFAFLASICRHLSLNRLDWNMAAKRKAEVVSLTEEMELCIPDTSLERTMRGKELGQVSAEVSFQLIYALHSYLDNLRSLNLLRVGNAKPQELGIYFLPKRLFDGLAGKETHTGSAHRTKEAKDDCQYGDGGGQQQVTFFGAFQIQPFQ